MPQTAQKPLGVVLLGFLAGFAGMLLAIMFLTLDHAPTPRVLVARASVAVLAVFAFAAAEALIRVRPWFYRASQALAAAYCAVVVMASVASLGPEGVLTGLIILLFSAVAILPILAYVRDERAKLTHMGPLVPAPPRPRPAPGRAP